MRFLEAFHVSLPDLPRASCADGAIPPDLFFPAGVNEALAILPTLRRVCDECPEKLPCLEFAVKEKIFHGIWGGTTPEERKWMALGKGSRPRKKVPSSSLTHTSENVLKSLPSSVSPQ